MKVVVAAFNQEKALEGAFSVITNLRMELFEALLNIRDQPQLQLSTPLLLLTIVTLSFRCAPPARGQWQWQGCGLLLTIKNNKIR